MTPGLPASLEGADSTTSGSSASSKARVAVVGISVHSIDGVRDHAELLARALRAEDVWSSVHWLAREQASLGAARSELRAWTQVLAGELHEERPDAILLHYSVFAYSYRGVPLFVTPTLAALRRLRIPLVTALHEPAYPWRREGWRGTVWALTQRAWLIEVVCASAALLVTSDLQAGWIASRPWLPRRRVAVAPVFSNLPPPSQPSSVSSSQPPSLSGSQPPAMGAPAGGRPKIVGLFGYSHEGVAIAPVLDAMHMLADRNLQLRLTLLGAPGRASASAKAWLAAARARGVGDVLAFLGPLSPQDLSDALAGCDVLLFADLAGPSSRKTTLAASLASGRPVLAIDGHLTWAELVRSGAARVVAPAADALAGALQELLADGHARETLGARGRAFAEREMSVARTAQTASALLQEALAASHAERAVR